MDQENWDKAMDANGCKQCGLLNLSNEAHICEHGVTPAPAPIEIGFTMEITDWETFRRMIWGG